MSREEIMRPFRMRYRASFRHESGAELSLSETSGPDKGLDEIQALVASLTKVKAPGWNLWTYGGDLYEPVSAEPEDMTPAEYHQRGRAAAATLACAGVEGAEHVRHLPAGWTRVIEQACDGIAARMELPDAGQVRIQQVKEKFGTMRFYVSAEGDETFANDIYQIAGWAETATEGRCCVTGQLGVQCGPGWVLTLNGKMAALRQDDMDKFREALYPSEPPEIEEPDLAP